MTATDKKRRNLAMQIGESFTAVRRRMLRSPAWLSLSAPGIKILMEIKARFRRYKNGTNNNGELYVSLIECGTLLKLKRATAVRGFAEIETKGFIFKTRQGEAGPLPRGGIPDGSTEGSSRKATLWALTDEPYLGRTATHAYENWRPPESETHRPKKQNHGSAGGPRTGPLVDPKRAQGSMSGPVEVDLETHVGSAGGPSVSTIYEGPKQRPRSRPESTHGATSANVVRLGSESLQKVENSERARRRPAWPAADRERVGLTQAELADLAGLARSYISIIERSRCKPSAARRALIEHALADYEHGERRA